jgi:dUTP pyrophosphatase
MSTHLFVKALNAADGQKYYAGHSTYHPGDAGLDLFFMRDFTVPARAMGFPLPLGIAAAMTLSVPGKPEKGVSYLLLPRSSISKTPLRLSNSIGLIDSGYRGEITAMVDNLSDIAFEVAAGTRLFQIVNGPLSPFTFSLVDELDATSRGTGGFGSTGTTGTTGGAAPLDPALITKGRFY